MNRNFFTYILLVHNAVTTALIDTDEFGHTDKPSSASACVSSFIISSDEAVKAGTGRYLAPFDL